MNARSTTLPFQRVLLTQGSAVEELTPLEFMAVPIHTRVRALLEGRVRFVDEAAGDIAPGQALKALHEVAKKA